MHLKWLGFLLLVAPGTVLAHASLGAAGSFGSGFLHPITGPDHVVAMIAVGIWGAQLRSPAVWMLPVTFPLVMALGGALGVLGVALPAVEVGIAASALVLGLLVALAVRLPPAVAGLIVAAFAIFHGHAHGSELPHAAGPVAYSIGFVLATGLLHASGVAFGLLQRWPAGAWLMRGAGALIALSGAWFLRAAVI